MGEKLKKLDRKERRNYLLCEIVIYLVSSYN